MNYVTKVTLELCAKNAMYTTKKYKSKVVTEVVAFTKFYPAEDYHQEYVFRNPTQGYVQAVSIPEYLNFRKNFKGVFKK